jgi:hypothetical protein
MIEIKIPSRRGARVFLDGCVNLEQETLCGPNQSVFFEPKEAEEATAALKKVARAAKRHGREHNGNQ